MRSDLSQKPDGPQASLAFLRGGGEMGQLIRTHDWSRSQVGSPETWPQPLRTALRFLLNTGHPMYVWWGPELLCFYNDAYRRSIGPERHPFSLGQPAEAVWAEIWDTIGPQIEQVMQGGEATWQENALIPITRNGRREDVYWTYSYGPIDDDAAPDGIGGVLVVCTETTDLVHARHQAVQDVERLAGLFQQAPGFMALLRGPDHVFELANPAYMELVGRRDLVGQPVRAVFQDVEGQGFFELLDSVFVSGEAYSTFGAPISLATADGATRRRLIDFVYQPIRDADGRVSGIFVQGSDVTDREAAEAARRASEARLNELAAINQSEAQFRLLVNGVTDYAIYMLDADGLVTTWNPGAQRIKGYAPEEIIGEHFSKFYTEPDRAAGAPQHGLDAARRDGRFETEGRRVRKDGTQIAAHVIIDAIRDERGDVIGFAKITRDISKQQAAQKALEEAREALFQAQKLEAIGQLTGGIAHDFNNLLMAVIGSLELAQKRLPDVPQLNRLIGNAIQGARRGATLTQRLLGFARRQELKREPVDLTNLVLGMEDLLHQSLGPSYKLCIDFGSGLPPVETDQAQLESALLNVVINARDAMPLGGAITVTAARESVGPDVADLVPGDYVRITIADDGEGMNEVTLARATEPFFTTKGIGKGTGLGLAMIHGLMTQSNGALRLKSTVGVGTEVALWLPVATGDPLPKAILSAAPETPFPRLTILAVDDDELVLFNTATMLEDLGHAVIQANSGEAALRSLSAADSVDLIITDHAMPGMTGAQLAGAISATRPGLPIILATGYSELPSDEGAGLAKLAKPFGQSQLAEAIANVFRINSAAPL